MPSLGWIGDAVIGLACSCMRIEELSNLKWADLDRPNNRIALSDKSGRGGAASEHALKPLAKLFPVVRGGQSFIDGHYFHLYDEEAQRRMSGLNLLGGAEERSDGQGQKF